MDKTPRQNEPAPSFPKAADAPALPRASDRTDARPNRQTPRSLLVAQSVFTADAAGAFTVPDAANLLILKPKGDTWGEERIVDRESNVFHKAIAYDDLGILTIGGNDALLKLWNKASSTWQAETLWHPKFGSQRNSRLRDFEVADFDGDGAKDLAIATHDQGVVAVVWNRNGKWVPEELDRKPDIIVHEIEVGDLDQNQKLEIYATPSDRNRLSDKAQAGKVIRFVFDGQKWSRQEVLSLDTRHVKEILVTDVDRDGKQELYVAVEARVEGNAIAEPVEIRRYDFKDSRFAETKVTTIVDRFCRFLVAGDIDHDGAAEIVATAYSAGVWIIEHQNGAYQSTCIDKNTGGIEHAAYIADIDRDNQSELYVADDKGGVIRKYEYQNGAYTAEVISRRLIPGQAMVWNITAADLP